MADSRSTNETRASRAWTDRSHLSLLLLALVALSAVVALGGAPSVAATDRDGDGFSDAAEAFVGTDPSAACNVTPVRNDEPVDAWPPDVDDDTEVSSSDIVPFRAAYGSTAADTAYDARLDLNADRAIGISDIVIMRRSYGAACEVPAPTPTPTPAPAPPPPSPQPAPPPAPTPTPAPSAGAPQLLFGLGPAAGSAIDSALVQQAPVWMLSSWYSSPSDLDWMTYWESDFIPDLYAEGYALHLIVYSNDSEGGTPCGRQYPIGNGIMGDMARLADIWGGQASDPPLYVTLFTEFQTFPCKENQWEGAADYYARLKTNMLKIRDVFHQRAPNARVSIGWGGWQVKWDDPAKGGGRSLFPHFADVMSAMDFQSFQAMQNEGNVSDVLEMMEILGQYGPVMLAHYRPDNGSQATFDADTQAMLTDDYLAQVTALGLFGWSFMDGYNLSASPASYNRVVDAVHRYGRGP
jgi:hypothetical protein